MKKKKNTLNPFVQKFLVSRPMLSARSARIAEEAWDKAIEECSRVANDRGDYETRDEILGLLSTQRKAGAK